MKKLYKLCFIFWTSAKDFRWLGSLALRGKAKQARTGISSSAWKNLHKTIGQDENNNRAWKNKTGNDNILKNPSKFESLWKNSKQSLPSAGFSFTELITVVGIIMVLGAVALPMYSKYKRRAVQSGMQVELSEIRKALSYAHSVDGGYHQRIYTAGYQPSQRLVAEAGTKYSRSDNPCCASFRIPDKSRFFTITNDNTGINSSVRATHTCVSGKCSLDTDCVPLSVQNLKLTPMSLSGSGGCSSDFSSKPFNCNCDRYRIYAVSQWGSSNMYLFANEKGKICASTNGSTVEEF